MSEKIVDLIPFSRVVVNEFPKGYKTGYPFKEGEIMLYLGEVVGMEGHCIVVNSSGKIFWGYHTENFSQFIED
jgi:hypothetical protein